MWLEWFLNPEAGKKILDNPLQWSRDSSLIVQELEDFLNRADKLVNQENERSRIANDSFISGLK